jgi:signal transduction histidine kinase/HAMP domain-containing protein
VIGSLRGSFAAKLIIGGCVLALVVVGGVAGYLIYSRTTQTQTAAQSNADNRVGVMAEVLDRFTGVQSLSAAASLATQPALAAALSSPNPKPAIAVLFSTATPVDLDGEVLLIADARGALVYTRPSPTVASGAAITAAPQAVVVALSDGRCSRGAGSSTPGGCGIELLSDGQPAYVVALPVTDGGRTVGAVAYVAPLGFQLDRFQALFNFPTAFIPTQRTDLELRPTLGGTASTDPALRAALGRAGGGTIHAIYNAPLNATSTGAVAGSFRPVYGSNGALTGYIGVEVPLASFVGDQRTDVLVVALIAVFVLLLVVLAVVLFVERFVKRPIARLESGVARIAGGDYTTSIPVRSKDELGRLAANVNRMRDSIAGYVGQIEEAREQLDNAVEQVSGVSRALTMTTAGVPALQQAVVRTAASLGGRSRSAFLAVREGDSLVVSATEGDIPPLAAWEGLDAVLQGRTVRVEHGGHGTLVAVPMFYQDNVIGALATIAPIQDGTPSLDTDLDVLTVLANNAAIAMENARLLEQERETVRRLRELDSLKGDFLATVQHELRTPLTAILGLADLLEMCWDMWEDGAKVDAVRDIQVAAKNLYDIVETIIDYSALADDRLGIHPVEVPLRVALTTTLAVVGERYKDGLPVPVDVVGDNDVSVFADPDRLVQVLRAIIDNGVKFSDGRGRMTIGFSTVSGGREVRIEIADEGVGISAGDLPRIFDRFFQVDNSATRQFGGTGMGLALVKRMVSAHGARIDVESTVGEGTRVVLLWPASEEAAAGGRPERADGPDQPSQGRSRRPVVPVQ